MGAGSMLEAESHRPCLRTSRQRAGAAGIDLRGPSLCVGAGILLARVWGERNIPDGSAPLSASLFLLTLSILPFWAIDSQLKALELYVCLLHQPRKWAPCY